MRNATREEGGLGECTIFTFGRRPEESRGEGPEASGASFETVQAGPGRGWREGIAGRVV